MKNKQKQKSGVTLIELIIVVVIIGVLSTLAITKFAQGNFSEKARIARLDDIAIKMAAAARHAKNSDNLEGLDLNREASGRWNGVANQANGLDSMGEYIASIPREIEVYIGVLTGRISNYTGDFNNDGAITGGNNNNLWDLGTDEVIFLVDPQINDLAPLNPNRETHLIVDQFGEIGKHEGDWINDNFTLIGPIVSP